MFNLFFSKLKVDVQDKIELLLELISQIVVVGDRQEWVKGKLELYMFWKNDGMKEKMERLLIGRKINRIRVLSVE